MGMGPRPTITTPDGRQMTQPFYDEYMRNQYQPQQSFNNSATAPIPGVTTPTSGGLMPNNTTGLLSNVRSQWMNNSMSPADWVSMLPSGGQPPVMMHPQGPMQDPAQGQGGPYTQQAMGMAGLLGQQQPGQQTGGGLLGGPKRGFRLPYGGK